jgi:iron complex outermembrane receptor protein
MTNRIVANSSTAYLRRLCSTASVSATIAVGLALPAMAQEVRGPEQPAATPQSLSPATTATVNARTGSDPAEVGNQIGGLEEIVVTARRVSENLQDVPVAITAFTGESLQQQNAVRVSDVARLTPGLLMREANSTPSAIAIALRGQVQTDVLATLDPSVGTYVDGLYWARAYGLNGDLLDIQSVQVLKGPQGTLFGRNTTGGALLIQSNDPSLSGFSGLASGTYGRFDERSGTAVLNVPIIENKLAIRAAVQRVLRDGWLRDRVTGDRYNNRNQWTARGKVLFKPTDNLSILLSGEYYKLRVQAAGRPMLYLVPAGLTAPAPSAAVLAAGASAAAIRAGQGIVNTPAAGIDPFSYPSLATLSLGSGYAGSNLRGYYTGINPNEVELSQGLAGNQRDFPDASPDTLAKTQTYSGTVNLDTFFGAVKFIGGYRKVDSFSRLDLDGSAVPMHRTIGRQTLEQWSGELQITGKAFDDRIDFAAGTIYFNESGFDGSDTITIPVGGAAASFPLAFQSTTTSMFSGELFNDSMGIYGQATFHANDRLSFTGGVRYSIDDKGLVNRNKNFNRATSVTSCQLAPIAQLAADCAQSFHDQFSGVSYLASVDYKVTDDILVYAKTSKGFRSGGQNLRAPSVAASIPFAPEIAYAHEGGFKSEFFDRRVRLNVAAYYSTIENIQRTTLIATNTTGGTATILSNAGKLRVYGLEGELTARLFNGFTLGTTGAITKPKYLDFSEIPNRTDLLGDRRRERIENVPEYTFSVSGNYEHQFDFGKFNIRGDYSWSSAFPLQPYVALVGDPLGVTIDPSTGRTIEQEIIKATTATAAGILSARASITILDDALELAVYGRNLTNNRNLVSSLYVTGLGYVAGVRRDPATYGVSATLRFGS